MGSFLPLFSSRSLWQWMVLSLTDKNKTSIIIQTHEKKKSRFLVGKDSHLSLWLKKNTHRMVSHFMFVQVRQAKTEASKKCQRAVNLPAPTPSVSSHPPLFFVLHLFLRSFFFLLWDNTDWVTCCSADTRFHTLKGGHMSMRHRGWLYMCLQ